MTYKLTVTDETVIDALYKAFHKKGFAKIGDELFEVVGYTPGPGLKPKTYEFELIDRCRPGNADCIVVLKEPLAIERAPTWNGPEDGLPPVGMTVEVAFGVASDWRKVLIVGTHGPMRVFYILAPAIDDPEYAAWGNRFDFRPIRTAEQVAAEERERIADELVQRFALHNIDAPWKGLFLQMYDSGVLKVQP